jgi:tripartite-type tricarboxylate transporter receptor subunit TctC
LQSPELRAELEGMGAEVINNTPEQYADQLRQDTLKWGEVVRKANIKAM